MSDSPAPRRIGLIAGGGDFPFLVARAAKRQGFEVICAGIKLEASPELAAEVDVFQPNGLLRLGGYYRLFRRHGVRRLTWAGWIGKDGLFSWRGVVARLPDWLALRFWFRKMRHADRQSQTMLSLLAEEFEENGFELAHSTELCPELLVEPGVLTKREPSRKQNEDIAFAWNIAKRMADLDVGQSVAVCDKATIAVEGMEGTDRNIERAGSLCKRPFTVAKVAMDGHDMRFDVPTIGPKTVETMRVAHAAVLAIEARKTIVLDRAKVVELADRYGIVIVALEGPPGEE